MASLMHTRSSYSVSSRAPSTPSLKGASCSGRRSAVLVRAEAAKPGHINPSIKKEEEKVADFINAKDLPAKAVFCRCWRTDKWPYCNGAHVKHNKETGDNVGPLVITNEAK